MTRGRGGVPGVASGFGAAIDPELPQPETIPITSEVTRKRFIGAIPARSPASRGDSLPGRCAHIDPIQLRNLAGAGVHLQIGLR